MKLIVYLFLVIQTVFAYDHLLEWNGLPLEVRVAALKSGDQSGTWSCANENDDDVEFNPRHRTTTNITFYIDGLYRCHVETAVGDRIRRYKETFKVVASHDLPLRLLSTSLHPNLVNLQFSYLTLSHSFLSSLNYLPNIAKFFREQMKLTSEMIDNVGKYLLAKQVTTSATDGVLPPDYVRSHFDHGFTPGTVSLEKIESVADAFEQAFKLETETVGIMTDMAKKAEALEDHELEQYLITDLITPILKRLKVFSNHINMVKAVSVGNQKLGEFLYDREFS